MDRRFANEIFGSDMSQNDPEFLKRCIYRMDILSNLVDNKQRLLLLNAPRGSGKSGLFLQMKNNLKYTENTLCIDKASDDLEVPQQFIDLNQSIIFWKNQILGWVFSKIGATRKFAFTEEQINSVELSRSHGSSSNNLIGIILDRFEFKSIPFSRTKRDPLIKEDEVIRLLKTSKKTYWVLLDEMDDNYDNTEKNNNHLAGLLLAAHALTKKIESLRIRITIRPHIMRVLESNYDKIPTLRELQLSIQWDADDLRKLLAKRIEYFLSKNNYEKHLSKAKQFKNDDNENFLISLIFDNFGLDFRNENTNKPYVYQTIATIAMYRPRLLIEFCKTCIEISNTLKISPSIAKMALHSYSNNRIAFLHGEHKFIYNNTGQILNEFASFNKICLGDNNELNDFIKEKIIHSGIVPCNGTSIELKSLDVARFLYMIDFIQAKQEINKSHYKFHYFIDNPILLSSWSNNTRHKWYIHPAFANGLDIDKNTTYRAGNSLKS